MRGLVILLTTAVLAGMTSCVEPTWTVDRTVSLAAVTSGKSPTGYVPPGNVIGLRSQEDILAGPAAPAQTYRAVLVRDMINGNGNILVPAGSGAQLIVKDFREDQSTGAEAQLSLSAVMINGQWHPVHAMNQPYGPLGTLVDSSRGVSGIVTK